MSIDKNLCIGCGLCEENLPAVFAVGDYTAYLLTPTTDAGEELVATAADCPTGAITLSKTTEVDAERS